MVAAWGPPAPACRGTRGAGIVRLALGARRFYASFWWGEPGSAGAAPRLASLAGRARCRVSQVPARGA